MNNKILTLLGLAQKSNNLFTGENTCEIYLKKNQIKLLIITEDASENTIRKFVKLCHSRNIPYIIYGKRVDLSKAVGKFNRTVYGIKDKNFSARLLELCSMLNGHTGFENFRG